MALSVSPAVVAFCLISFASAAWNDKVYSPQVAMFCGKLNMHLDLETGGWIEDPNGTTSCLRTPADVQSYCQKVYPTLSVVDVSEAEEQTVIHNWCRKGHRHCTGHSHIVLPYRCLVAATKQMEAPEGCESSRRARHHGCKQPKQLKSIAKKACGDLVLHSHSVAKPCGDNGFRAVDFVCCPSPPSSITTLDFNTSEETDLSAEELDSGLFKNESEEEVEWGRFKEEAMQEAEETTDEDAYLLGIFDDFDVEEQESSEEESEATQEPVKADPLLEYLETPGDDREHERFVLARQALDDKYRSLKMQLMREWEDAEFEGHMKTDTERNFMREGLQRRVQELRVGQEREVKRLVEAHQARVEALLNDRRRQALQDYLSALEEETPRPSHVLHTLKVYLRAERKDIQHTARRFLHLQHADSARATAHTHMVKAHLLVILERVNQSVFLLHHMPDLSNLINSDVQEMVSELQAYGRAQLPDVSGREPHAYGEDGLLPAEEAWMPYRPFAVHSVPRLDTEAGSGEAEDPKDEEVGVALVEETGMQTEKLEPERQFELDSKPLAREFSQAMAGMEQFNRGAVIALLVGAAVVGLLIVASVLLLRRRPYSPVSSLAEVDEALTPEERHLNKMQQNGYENPTYKFYEGLHN